MKIGLISCTKKKKSFPCQAQELYSESTLFSYALDYCRKHYDKIYILSAKHGLVDLHWKIEPYDKTLNTMNKEERKKWAVKTASQLKKKIKKKDVLYFHAGKNYREFLILLLDNQKKIPLKHLGIGKQLGFYKNSDIRPGAFRRLADQDT